MEDNNRKNYLLVIKRGKNDYLPLEWFKSSIYKGQDLNSLLGIDAFTSCYEDYELIQEALNLGLVDLDDRFIEFAIIFYEKGKWRELKEGPIFIDSHVMKEDEFLDYLAFRSGDKVFINNVCTLFGKGFSSNASKQFYMILKNIESFRLNGDEFLRRALEPFKTMDYEEKRKLRAMVSTRVMNEVTGKQNNGSSKVYKINNNDTI